MIGGIDFFFEPIQIQRSTNSTDSWGNPIQTWSNYLVVQGRLRQLNGNETYASSKDTSTSTHRLYMRPANILVSDRVSHDGKYFKIVSINNVMTFDELFQVDCELYE